ncbi:MAG: SlyX family protein [Syntrophobacterales bacterium]|nr:SlyX family protein [Syntrophobacterales bacterium]
MKSTATFVFLSMLLSFSLNAGAQTMEERLRSLEGMLKKQEATIEALNSLRDTLMKQERMIREQQNVIEELKAQMKKSEPPPLMNITGNEQETSGEIKQEIKELKEKVEQAVEAQKKDVASVFNPSIGLVSDTIFSYNNRKSAQTGSVQPGGYNALLRSIELNIAASIDPFARGYAVFDASVNLATGETDVSVAEAAIQTTSLPWNLTMKAGRFFGEFGRLSYVHDHELPFVNRPLVLDKYVGGESKTDGVQINYLLPVSHYVSLTAGAGTQFGDIPNNVGSYRSFNNLNFFGRASTYFDLTPDISIEPGISGLWNPNTFDRGGVFLALNDSLYRERERRLFGADFVVSYRPLRNNQFQALTWGTEVLYSDNRYDVVSPSGTMNRAVGVYGLYSYLTYKFQRQWTTGIQYEWLQNPESKQDTAAAYSANITWSLSHWNRLRLQFTRTEHNSASFLSPNNAIYLQWTWIIGSHAHGWQQR